MPIFVGISVYAVTLGVLGIIVLWELKRYRRQKVAKWRIPSVEIGGRDGRQRR